MDFFTSKTASSDTVNTAINSHEKTIAGSIETASSRALQREQEIDHALRQREFLRLNHRCGA